MNAQLLAVYLLLYKWAEFDGKYLWTTENISAGHYVMVYHVVKLLQYSSFTKQLEGLQSIPLLSQYFLS